MGGGCDGLKEGDLAFRRQEPPRRSFENDRGQGIRPNSARVDVDSPAGVGRFFDRMMAVNDRFARALVGVRVVKFTAYPEAILRALIFKRDAGSEAGMDKRVVPDDPP
jgi:hypothetical protein